MEPQTLRGQQNSLSILYVGTVSPHHGGAAVLGYQILMGLARLGHRVRTLAPIPAQARRSAFALAASHPEILITWYPVPFSETDSSVLPTPEEYRKLEDQQIHEKLPALIRSEQPDVIIIGKDRFAWHVPRLALEYSIPTLLLIQGGVTTGILSGVYPDAMAQRFLEQCRKVDVVVTVARHWGESLLALGLEDVRVIHNPVDLCRFSPRPRDQDLRRNLAIGENDTIVLHASNLKRLKRPMDIVDSAEITLRRTPTLVYVIVGDGALREPMENACREKRISNRFRFVPWVAHERMPDYFNLADIVVMPSETETQALVYLEAQSCGRVILASDIAAAREVIEEGETGLLFRKGDVDDLAAKTLLATGDPDLRAHIGRKARERVQIHSLSDTVATYARTLHEVIDQHR